MFTTRPDDAAVGVQRLREAGFLPGADEVPFELEEVAYDFNQLRVWADAAYDLADRVELTLVRVNESANQVDIGASGLASVDAIISHLEDLGVPDEAFSVTEVQPYVMDLQNLTDEVRPVPGGVRITRGTRQCTLGANTEAPGYDQHAVTASHCTGEIGSTNYVEFFQPDSATTFGFPTLVEVLDPPHDPTVSCPANADICKRSDVALLQYQSAVNGDPWKIAFPFFQGTTSIDQLVHAEGSGVPQSPFIGFWVDGMPAKMIGASAGRQDGTIIDPCAGVTGTPPGSSESLHMPCAILADYSSLGGDSGAPVLARVGVWAYTEPGSAPNHFIDDRLIGFHSGRHAQLEIAVLSSYRETLFDFCEATGGLSFDFHEGGTQVHC